MGLNNNIKDNDATIKNDTDTNCFGFLGVVVM